NSQATNIVVPPIEKERIKVFQPKDLNDKVLMDLVQMLIDRSQSLEKKLEQQRQKLEALSQSHHTHRHNYEVTISGTEGEKSFITIGMLQNLLENYDAGHASKGHIFKKGAMFGLKYDVKSYSKETSTPK
ncbi:MAG: hypothetical protein KC592_14150, partial [Nitrospira sp.]|nr:hypothetical protein [Nitrospira sp.]